MPIYRVEYHLLQCDTCGTEYIHPGEDLQQLLEAARKSEWHDVKFDDGHVEVYCPDHILGFLATLPERARRNL